ncbi:orotidine-5'-phosphate decarboxylase [Thermanaeromonas sp. C210]|uniref:orotidine-5'-phosphate decarboxylase n=1 Tax=Thermanaeromonas sp. C210 TaxID=2731925 RepID=UPI00155C983D|nr:orotidine-5'-phosphate decarboxylase [Thermanaeromonas sp. C210]GFN24038.1 orotidine 5'-phosphate decarboxylase [Thermanaeromonas sp. C210]
MSNRDKLIVALDVADLGAAEKLVAKLAPYVGMFKVGLELYTAAGPAAVHMIKERGGRVFADLKLHDIPNTVARAARALVRHGVDMLNVHAAGGSQMLRAAVEAVKDEADGQGRRAPLLIAVTVLTSLDEAGLREEVGVRRGLVEQVVFWARLARECGLDGVVASALELEAIRRACGPDWVIVTPGIRPQGSRSDDQSRVLTPGEAVRRGASYLVVGRPVISAPDPVEAAVSILGEMGAT